MYYLMSIDDKRIESVTDFFHTVTFGMERKHYNGIELGSNIFIIYRIGRMKECTMSDITNYLNIIASTATRRVDKLVKLKLVERITGESDRRQIKLRLTSTGSYVYSEILLRQKLRFEELKSGFSDKELEVFFKIIEYMYLKGPIDNIAKISQPG